MFLRWRDAAEASQSLHLPLLIIPIIMAHCENLINNTEDIVVAISHMVVGLCSVTTLPLASTYVCQKRAAMTSCTSAHLALPPPSRQAPNQPRWGGRGGGGGGRERATPPGILPVCFLECRSWSGPSNGTKCQSVSWMANHVAAAVVVQTLPGSVKQLGGGWLFRACVQRKCTRKIAG